MQQGSQFNTALMVIILVIIAAVGGAWWYKNYGMEQKDEAETGGLEINLGTQSQN